MLVGSKKKILYFILALLIIIAIYLIFPERVSADADTLLWGGYYEEVEDAIGLGSTDDSPQIILARIINVFISFVGLIAVTIILLGGFKWMTSGGNEEKIAESRKLLLSGATGLIIIMLSWSISSYLIDTITNAMA